MQIILNKTLVQDDVISGKVCFPYIYNTLLFVNGQANDLSEYIVGSHYQIPLSVGVGPGDSIFLVS